MTDPRARPRMHPEATLDAAIALCLGAGAALAYSLTFHPDWIYDPLRYAQLMQGGPVRILLGPQHALGNLLPFAAFRAARAMGYGGRAMPVLAAFGVAGGAVAVAAAYLAATRMGGSRLAATTGAAVLGAAAAPWRAGGSGGVYGVAYASVALGWVVAAGFVRAPTPGRGALLGVAAGAAVAAHLGNVAFVAGAVLVVLVLGPPSARGRTIVAFATGVVATAGALFVVASGVAAGWSPSGMVHWFLHPGIGGPTDRSALVGWGIAGMYPSVVEGQPHLSWLPGGFGQADGHLQILVTVLLLGLAGVRGLLLAARSRVGAILATALAANAGLAFLLASWYQSGRSDYWGLGLIPIAVMAGAGTVSFRRRSGIRRAAAIAAAGALVGGVLAWNASQEVAPSLQLSDGRARVADAIARRVSGDAHVVVSLVVAGRLADAGYDAEGGFSALQRAVRAGVPKPGVAPLIREARVRPVYVSPAAFRFNEVQSRYLGGTRDDVWVALRRCCRLKVILRARGLPAPETIYRLRPD